jgi:hypothetical protein
VLALTLTFETEHPEQATWAGAAQVLDAARRESAIKVNIGIFYDGQKSVKSLELGRERAIAIRARNAVFIAGIGHDDI